MTEALEDVGVHAAYSSSSCDAPAVSRPHRRRPWRKTHQGEDIVNIVFFWTFNSIALPRDDKDLRNFLMPLCEVVSSSQMCSIVSCSYYIHYQHMLTLKLASVVNFNGRRHSIGVIYETRQWQSFGVHFDDTPNKPNWVIWYLWQMIIPVHHGSVLFITKFLNYVVEF